MQEKIIMSGKEIDRYHIIRQIIDKQLLQITAAATLGLSDRQTRRLQRKVEKEGAKGLIHLSRGQPSHHKLPDAFAKKVIDKIREKYSSCEPTFTSEKLFENEGLKISVTAIRNLMIKEGLWLPKKRGTRHRKLRERKSAYGEMIQFDGSDHDWFEDRGPRCTLLLGIDDATGKLVHGLFAEKEALRSVFSCFREYFQKHGRPASIYLDRHSIYKTERPIQGNGKTFEETQFARAMAELDIKIIYAYSPQAKGRIERSFGTHQNRLVKELRLAGINTLDGANQFLNEIYLPKHNRRFAVTPKSSANLHRPLRPADNLDHILSLRSERLVTNDFTILYEKEIFQLERFQPVNIFPKTKVIVEEWIDESVHLFCREKELNWHRTEKPLPVRKDEWVIPARPKSSWKPPITHPWKRKFLVKQTAATGHF